MAVAQRLARKVCKKCSELKTPTAEELEKIKNGLKNIPKNVKVPEINEKTKIPRIKGCKECNFTGFQGRIGVFEAFLVDDDMEKFILTGPSIPALKEKAVNKGMVTMYQDGLIKILNGMTTLEEIEKITGE
jgi:type II secretory ATPase GspE/PulE/Tfp pilus assembly ATPase PilB-like protein